MLVFGSCDRNPRRKAALPTAIVALTVSLWAIAPAAEGHDSARSPLPMGERLFDMGVADIDHDGRLDIFGTAHENAARALLAHGRSGFRAASGELGFGADGDFPGLGNTGRPPTERRDGTYVYVHRVDDGEKDLYLRIDARGEPADLDLALAPARNVKDVKVHRGRVEASDHGHRSDAASVHLDTGGWARFRVNLDLPIHFHSTGRTFVGSKAIETEDDDFTVRLADTHANVFADLDGNGTDDLFRVVGGLGGGIAKPRLRGQVKDQTRLWSGAAYDGVDLGLDKDDCRGRQASALDIDGDGDTDLFESCAGRERGTAAAPVAWLAGSSGYERERLPMRGEVYRWVPTPESSRPALLALGKRAELWQRDDTDWDRLASARLRGGPGQTTFGDFDGDRRGDVYVSSFRGSTLLRIGRHSLRAQDPGKLGLPGESDAAAWVDADGDGSLDLHSVPAGLYAGKHNGFQSTGLLGGGGRYAHLSWADFDNNGLREPVIAQTDGEFTIASSAWWYGPHPVRRKSRQPWLEVQTPGNWLTARIVVTPDHGPRRVGWAGEAETSRFSQGQNRTYFILPKGAAKAKVAVETADGETHRLEARAGRIVRFGG